MFIKMIPHVWSTTLCMEYRNCLTIMRLEHFLSPNPPPFMTPSQRGVQLHNNARKLPQQKTGNGAGGGGEWKAAAVAYLRAAAASLVSLGSTTSPKDW